MNSTREQDDLIRLNAFVDGEVGPAERAEIAARIASDRGFARCHAVLARLKASVMEQAGESAADSVALPAPRRRRLAYGLAAAAALVLMAGGFYSLQVWQPPQLAIEQRTVERLVVLAALPSAPVVPELNVAGLNLSGIELRQDNERPTLVATYTGPRGCKLELRMSTKAGASSLPEGTSQHGWEVGKLSYKLVAFGMPDIRFAVIAGAVERQTRRSADPAIDSSLRQARVTAPPCLG